MELPITLQHDVALARPIGDGIVHVEPQNSAGANDRVAAVGAGCHGITHDALAIANDSDAPWLVSGFGNATSDCKACIEAVDHCRKGTGCAVAQLNSRVDLIPSTARNID